MAYTRKNQKDLSSGEWDAFVSAVNQMHGVGASAPAYRDFVAVHVKAMSGAGMAWRVHTMMGMVGRNFLAWHRQFLLQFERRLRKVEPTITLPYWDWIRDPKLPAALSKPALLSSWSVTRKWDSSLLPTKADVTALNARTTFSSFQRVLEQIHNNVHLAVGGLDGEGTMSGANSPADPIFFLHHANVDRLWAEWQTKHPRAKPSNFGETLQPKPLFGVKVSSVLRISALGYRYH
jgi:tyrosinase